MFGFVLGASDKVRFLTTPYTCIVLGVSTNVVSFVS